jgi:ribosome biogenesis protein Nip4
MKVYNIIAPGTYSQTHCVVAKNMGEAEALYLKEYPGSSIEKIELHAVYVIVDWRYKEDL